MKLFSSRIAVVFMSRRRGVPVNPVNHRVCEGAVSAEDLDMGVGVYGVDPQGTLVARIGIYHRSMGALVFRHTISLDCSTGRARQRLRENKRASELLESDRAMVNWISTMLFRQDIQSGAYQWGSTPPVPISTLDQEQIREIDALDQFTKPRGFFAAERRLDVLGDFFQQHLKRTGDLSGLVAPSIINLAALFSGARPEGAVKVSVRARDLRSLVIHQFVSGLRSRMGNFYPQQEAVVRAFRLIEGAVHGQDGGRHVARSMAARFALSLQEGAEKHLATQKLDDVELKKYRGLVVSAMAGLKIFAENFPSPLLMHHVKDLEPQKDSVLFELVRPAFSVQLLEGIDFDSHFPEDGNKIFHP